MYCLDTNIIIEHLRDNRLIKEKIIALTKYGADFSITPITICELYKGAYKSKNIEHNIKQVKTTVATMKIIEFNENAYLAYGKIHKELMSKGTMTSEMDLLIGCLAYSFNATLVTQNKKHFENIQGLKVEEW
ncbi:MAG: type II toxin-antitoxin system VapC family toxin [Nanoarchaeota archaeon]|nr:type II toxin-antitoxin system VapC family toxin [Nanoarchaeota archaeon]